MQRYHSQLKGILWANLYGLNQLLKEKINILQRNLHNHIDRVRASMSALFEKLKKRNLKSVVYVQAISHLLWHWTLVFEITELHKLLSLEKRLLLHCKNLSNCSSTLDMTRVIKMKISSQNKINQTRLWKSK